MPSQSKETEPRTAPAPSVPERLPTQHTTAITDGPFAETKELLGGRTPVNAKRR